ncbi:FapA family protein [Caldithrix abyssi]
MNNEKQIDAGVKLISLMDGKLILAEKLKETITSGELLAVLKRAGITEGILPGCFPLLARTDMAQVPVARAFYRDEPPVFNVAFGLQDLERQILEDILAGRPFDAFEEKFSVKRNTVLLSVQKPFIKVLKYPDGHIEKKGNLSLKNYDIFCGKNTSVYQNSIVALIDGSAHRTKDGRVHVYPVLTVKGMGEIHGKVDEEIAIKVTGDIHSNSYLESPSNVFVLGAIHSSFVKAEGNIQALEGIDNTKEIESSRILSKGKVITVYIRNYRVHAKDKVLVSEGIHNSLVIAHDEVWANFIESSEIRCHKGIVTNHIRGKSRIFLGPSYIKEDDVDSFRHQIQLSEKKLKSQEFEIKEIKDRLEKEKQTLMGYFLRLKDAGKTRVMLDSSIIRLFNSLKLSFEQYEESVKKYERLFAEYLAYKSYLINCQRAIKNTAPPFVKVMGRIEPGVIIATPAHVVKVSKPLDHVLIFIDPITGRLRFTNDFKMLSNLSEKSFNKMSNYVQQTVENA